MDFGIVYTPLRQSKRHTYRSKIQSQKIYYIVGYENVGYVCVVDFITLNRQTRPMPMPIKPRPRLEISAIELLSVNIQRLRTARGWTQDNLAYEAGLHRTQIGHIESKARTPSLETLECVAAALEVSLAALFTVPVNDMSFSPLTKDAEARAKGVKHRSTRSKSAPPSQ